MANSSSAHKLSPSCKQECQSNLMKPASKPNEINTPPYHDHILWGHDHIACGSKLQT